MVRWTTVVVAVVLAVSGVVVSGAVIAWWRSPGRVEYRADRRALRRAVRRWTRLASSPAGTSTDRQVRRLEHLLDVATQACRARRRNTGLVRYLRDWREPQPEHLDTPFERRFLIEAHQLLDQLATQGSAGEASAAPRSNARTGEAVAEPA